jgi:HAD superfamily hydrolase (TIGR01662 family)
VTVAPGVGSASRIRAVVFDVGETLVDETRVWSVWADWLGIPRLTLFAALGGTIVRGEEHRRAAEIVRPGLDVRAEERRAAQAGAPYRIRADDLYPDAIPALQALRAAGYRVGVAANQPATTARVIEDLGVELDLVATSEGWRVAKPDPAFFGRVAAELGLPASEVAYVGDRIDNDIVPAAAAGMVAIHVRRGPWGYLQAGEPAAAMRAGAAAQVESLTDLPDVLRTLQEQETAPA